MWDLIVSVPDHCLSFYFAYILVLTRCIPRDCQMTFGLVEVSPRFRF